MERGTERGSCARGSARPSNAAKSPRLEGRGRRCALPRRWKLPRDAGPPNLFKTRAREVLRAFARENEDNRRRARASITFCKVSLVTRTFQVDFKEFSINFFFSELVAAECWNHVDDWWWDSGMPGAPHRCYILGSSSYIHSPHHW